MKTIAFYIILLGQFTSQVTAQTTVTLIAEKDNTMYENDGSLSNGAGNFLFAGQTNNADARRGLIKFDLSNIPNTANIINVSLKTFCSKTRIAGSFVPVTLHRVLKDWGETTTSPASQEGKGASAAPGDATWTDNFFGSSQWTNAGGDYDNTISSNILASEGMPNNWTGVQLINDVQNWIDGSPNHGWVFIGDETNAGSIAWINSRENLQNPPILEITYTSPSLCPNIASYSGTINSGTYQASDQITLSSGIVSPGSMVLIRAGQSILVDLDSELNHTTELVIGPCQ